MEKKYSVLLLGILFLLMVGFFYSTGPGMREFCIFTILSALLVFSVFLMRHYYKTDNSALNQGVIYICMGFIKISIFYIAVRELAGFSLNFSTIAFFFITLLIFTLWGNLDLTLFEKGVLVITLITIFGIRVYEGIVTTPSTAVQFYRSELSEVTSYEDIQELLHDDFRKDFTLEDFQDLEPYLQQYALRINQPTLLEFSDGRIILMEVFREDRDKPLRISNIEHCCRMR